MSSQMQLEVNRAVTAALQREEEGSQHSQRVRKRKYTMTFIPEDCAKIGKYANENGNAAAVKKYKVTHGIGESTVCLFSISIISQIEGCGFVARIKRIY